MQTCFIHDPDDKKPGKENKTLRNAAPAAEANLIYLSPQQGLQLKLSAVPADPHNFNRLQAIFFFP